MDFTYNNPAFKGRRRDLRNNPTEAEKILWRHLRNKQFFGIRFYRQYSVGAYILDFFSPKLRLAVELDGGHHAEPENREYDDIRTDFLKGCDIEVLRFWNSEVFQNIEGVLHRIAERVSPPDLTGVTPPSLPLP